MPGVKTGKDAKCVSYGVWIGCVEPAIASGEAERQINWAKLVWGRIEV